MVDLESGSIRVDGRDITHVGLDTASLPALLVCATDSQLRNALAIIPQDAFLFEGTVR